MAEGDKPQKEVVILPEIRGINKINISDCETAYALSNMRMHSEYVPVLLTIRHTFCQRLEACPLLAFETATSFMLCYVLSFLQTSCGSSPLIPCAVISRHNAKRQRLPRAVVRIFRVDVDAGAEVAEPKTQFNVLDMS